MIDGSFYVYNDLNQGDTLAIKSCKIDYIYDTKGYYQSIYTFETYLNNVDYPLEIQVPALIH